MRSDGVSTRQRVVMSAGRGGALPGRGRSEDQPPRSSAPILTLRWDGGFGMPPSCQLRHYNPAGCRAWNPARRPITGRQRTPERRMGSPMELVSSRSPAISMYTWRRFA